MAVRRQTVAVADVGGQGWGAGPATISRPSICVLVALFPPVVVTCHVLGVSRLSLTSCHWPCIYSNHDFGGQTNVTDQIYILTTGPDSVGSYLRMLTECWHSNIPLLSPSRTTFSLRPLLSPLARPKAACPSPLSARLGFWNPPGHERGPSVVSRTPRSHEPPVVRISEQTRLFATVSPLPLKGQHHDNSMW